MRQHAFESAHDTDWADYRRQLECLESGAARKGTPATFDLNHFPRRYRQLCAQYALSVSRGYSPGLIGELHDLVRRGYRQLYRRRLPLIRPAIGFMAERFPRTLRRHARLFWLASALFLLPLLAIGLGTHADAELIYSLIEPDQVAELESMYDPANRKPGRAHERQADTDVAMFGYYIMNNVGLGFRCFAWGLLLGIGSAFLLVFNGLYIGAIAGHLTRIGEGEIFWPFVSGHAPYELTAIVISGAAGLLLGRALLAPGNRTRLAALRLDARDAVVLVGGAALMLLFAAVVEAFWSSGQAAPWLKYSLGGLGWLLVATYLTLAGRGADHAA